MVGAEATDGDGDGRIGPEVRWCRGRGRCGTGSSQEIPAYEFCRRHWQFRHRPSPKHVSQKLGRASSRLWLCVITRKRMYHCKRKRSGTMKKVRKRNGYSVVFQTGRTYREEECEVSFWRLLLRKCDPTLACALKIGFGRCCDRDDLRLKV